MSGLPQRKISPKPIAGTSGSKRDWGAAGIPQNISVKLGLLSNAFETALDRIQKMRSLVRGFPYSIFFRVRSDEIRILGVIHQHRDPQDWMRRLQ
jgi:hypothetical protein